mmetsp:Transcript_110795/g.320197  ORF Transcript_110795/g.320197 Transcript_110795/m.320197 type:complete len:320 (+) Transcript_110795:243-1202(+)
MLAHPCHRIQSDNAHPRVRRLPTPCACQTQARSFQPEPSASTGASILIVRLCINDAAEVFIPEPCNVPLAGFVVGLLVVAVECGDFGLGEGAGRCLVELVIASEARWKERPGARRHAQPQSKSTVELPHSHHKRLHVVRHRLRHLEGEPTKDDELAWIHVRRLEPPLRLHHLRQHRLDERILRIPRPHVTNKWHTHNLYTRQRPIPRLEHAIRRARNVPAAEGEDELPLRPNPADVQTPAAIRNRELLRTHAERIGIQAARGALISSSAILPATCMTAAARRGCARATRAQLRLRRARADRIRCRRGPRRHGDRRDRRR